jgi:sugar lactone lactonase YvrE
MRSSRRRGRLAVALGMVAALGAVSSLTADAEWRSFKPPFTGALDFVIGFPACGGLGPTGLLFDGSHVFIADFCGTGKVYRFSASGGTVSTAQASSSNGLDIGLATSGGGYFGAVDHDDGALTVGVYRFDPTTLAVGAKLFSNDGNGVRDIVVDPTTGDLYFSVSSVGIYHMAAPNSGTPKSVEFAPGDFDGLTFSSDGSQLYAANFANKHINAFNRAGARILDVNPGHPVDGMALDSSGNVFANANDGTIVRLDHQTQAVSVVAIGGTRGDLARVGPDGCMYATQSDRVTKLQPCFFPSPPNLGGSFPWLIVVVVAIVVVALLLVAILRRRRRGAEVPASAR